MNAAPPALDPRSPLCLIRSAEPPITFARPDRAAFTTAFRLLAVAGLLLMTASYWFASASRRS
ncbi:MAG: hypothetical protein ACKV19_08155 [Verrucomicrobiales bacterium]